MRVFQVAKGIDLDFPAANGTAIDMTGAEFPFQPGGSAIAVLALETWAEAALVGASMKLQGSDNGFSGWEDLAAAGGVAAAPVVMAEITIPEWLRWSNQSVTAGDGRGSIHLLQN